MTPDQRRYYQIMSETDICADYFNDLLAISDTDVLLNPERYRVDLGTELPKRTAQLRTYSEYARDQAKKAGGRWATCLSPEDFITEKNRDSVQRLDAIATVIRAPEPAVDQAYIKRLLQLMFEAALLIYGEGQRANLQKRFKIQA